MPQMNLPYFLDAALMVVVLLFSIIVHEVAHGYVALLIGDPTAKFSGGKHAFWTHPKGENDSGHPTGKPIGRLSNLIGDFTEPGEIVFDPFMGSGTTGVACANLGRKFIGNEIEPKYFDIASERIENAYRQVRLFA